MEFKINETLVVSDMDGTLLNSDKKIDDYSLKVLKELQDKGLSFSLATSRPYGAIKRYCRELDVRVPMITSSGTIIYDFITDKIIKAEILDRKVLDKIRTIIPWNNIIIHTTDNLYMNEASPRHKFFLKGNEFVVNENDLFYPGKITCAEDLDKFDEICQISMGIDGDDPTELINQLNEVLKDEDVNIFYTGDMIVGVIKKGVSKAKAAFYLADYLGIDKDNIIAFGDNMNDYEMLENIKHSVAMENAVDELKAIAEKTTTDNNSSGVVYALLNIYKLV
ncbi:MAG: Cof-type HAD-IIB family hydrolase [Erysipelotrichaceae bacterium]|nr:Cof-type HAD-IIB family hydrolase [Erysipelotrichaceae bacterium]